MKAKCAGLPPEWFHVGVGESVEEARAVCLACPVRWDCLLWILNNELETGLYGGFTYQQRKMIKRALRPRSPEDLDAGELANFVNQEWPEGRLPRRK